ISLCMIPRLDFLHSRKDAEAQRYAKFLKESSSHYIVTLLLTYTIRARLNNLTCVIVRSLATAKILLFFFAYPLRLGDFA
ncbi:hypothetical protein JW998_06725, partial [candidate division KSB1 bacterium]|nr:hypothetical protein [candidate division KSB1 bacterium]